MDQRTLVFDQELYNEMVYRTPDEMFHTFEADNCVAGLSFLSSDEAQTFKLALEERLNKRKSRCDRLSYFIGDYYVNGSYEDFRLSKQ